MNKPRPGDIYRWGWNEKTLKEREYKNASGTMYWCCSRICIFKNDGMFWDTFWGGNDSDKKFSIEDAILKLDLEYLGNFEDLEKTFKEYRAYYNDSDCVDLSHPNSSQDNFYIRKGAKKSLNKMRRVLMRYLKKLDWEADYAKREADRIRSEIENLSIDAILQIADGIDLTDSSYEDEITDSCQE